MLHLACRPQSGKSAGYVVVAYLGPHYIQFSYGSTRTRPRPWNIWMLLLTPDHAAHAQHGSAKGGFCGVNCVAAYEVQRLLLVSASILRFCGLSSCQCGLLTGFLAAKAQTAKSRQERGRTHRYRRSWLGIAAGKFKTMTASPSCRNSYPYRCCFWILSTDQANGQYARTSF